jgi:hypothetical protein
MKRDAAQTIWRTVVFAGAMLGAPACGKSKPATTTPPTTSDPAKPDPTATAKPDGTDPATPNPCGGDAAPRPRGTDDDGGGGVGRGFVLS